MRRALRPSVWTSVASAGLALGLLLGPVGCKGKKSEPAAGAGTGAEKTPPVGTTITPTEADTGRKACNAYVEQVCRCARTMPELKGDCDLAHARPQALEMSLRAAMAEGNATLKDRVALVANAHNIIRACIEDGARLVQRGCRPARPGDSPESSAPGSSAPASGSGSGSAGSSH